MTHPTGNFSFPKLTSLFIILAASAVLTGWLLDITLLKTFIPNEPDMKMNSALCFIMAGVILYLLSSAYPARKNIIALLSGMISLIALITLTEHATGVDTGLDLYLGDNEEHLLHPGRMSPDTSFNFLITGIAFLFFTTTRYNTLKRILGLLIIGVALLGIAGHLYEVCPYMKSRGYSLMAFHSCLLFLLIGRRIIQLARNTGVTAERDCEEELRAVNKEMETFIYKATHDIRGPLSSIIGIVGLGEKEIKDPDTKVMFDMIGASARKLDNTLVGLVQNMNIKDSRLFSQEMAFEKIISESMEKFSHYKGYSRIKISCGISVQSFLSNQPIMESIFQNMIENAIKYQDFEKESYLRIEITEDQSGIRLLFRDNGIGIAPSMQEKIFEIYCRATQESTGSGLGLYLVKTGVEKLKGRIEVKSEPGNGTEFVIILPRLLAIAS